MGENRDGAEFMMLFEKAVWSDAPLYAFVVVFTLRFILLVRERPKTVFHAARLWKLAFGLVLVALQVTLLVLWSHGETWRSSTTLTSSIINVVLGFQFVALSWMEDTKSIRPSSILTIYLLYTLLLDITQTRLLWLEYQDTTVASIFIASFATKASMLLLESRDKRKYLKQAFKNLPPEATSGVINRSFLWWLNALFVRGLRSFLRFDDLYPLDDELSSKNLGIKTQEAWDQRRKPERRFELPMAACKALWRPMVSAAFPRICLIGFKFAQPFLISRVLNLLTEANGQDTTNMGYELIGATALIYLGMAISDLHYNHNLYRFVTMFRGASVALIYNHTLALPVGEYDGGAVVTLMSTDVDSIVFCLVSLDECWSCAIEVVIGIVLLAQQLGWTCIVPVLVVIISFFGSTEISKTIGDRQKIWVDAVQKRISITTSMLSDMRSVKMMGLSTVLSSIIQDHRVEETHRMAGFRWSIVWQNVVQNLPWSLAPALTFVIYVAQAVITGESSMGATKAFTSLSIITLLTIPASKLLSAIPSTAASLGCFDRIQEFLVTSPRVDERIVSSLHLKPYTDDGVLNEVDSDAFAITADCVSIRPATSAELLLRNVSFTIPRGSLTMAIGPVGSGKTTLLNAILGEVPCEDGCVRVSSRRIALCVQVPWLPNTTIRQAITGYIEDELDLDEAWYQKCIYACALDQDLDAFPNGDQTQIGSASTALSGGQRHRIALARAVYARADIILLDDVLSALDANTQAAVMSRLFGEAGLLRKLAATVVLVTHATQFLGYADKILIASDGGVQDGGTGEQLISTGLSETFEAGNRSDAKQNSTPKPNSKQDGTSEALDADKMDDLSRATGDMAVYRYYFRSVGWRNAVLFLIFVFMSVFGNSFSHIWLKWWTDIGGGQIAVYTSVYLALAALTSVGEYGYIWTMIILISPSTGRKLHAALLNVVMRARQSFFSVTDSGSILNRFSQDMTIVESQLPTGVLIAVTNLFSSIAAVALVATGSIYMSISIPFLLITIWALQHVYLRTSRQLRLLDLEAKSPLYSHFLDTMSGLITIRAFGWERQFIDKNNRVLDYSQQPHYLLYCIQRWLNLVLDLIAGAQAVLVVGLAVGLRHSVSPGLLGVSLNNILSFSGALSSFVSGWAMLETSLGSIARLMNFEATVKPEDKDGETCQPPQNWPDRGSIEFRDVTASHVPGAVGIRNISLQVRPGQKIGVCGRTGSGKSSLVATILRLLEIDAGAIFIDGIDLAMTPRETIRERLLVIPQDPLVLRGSVRFNVDPHGRSSDETIIAALKRVGLWVLTEAKGLDANISSSLSQGQRQLLALARALVKKKEDGSMILLLDEATSNVDVDTDAVLQRVISEDFVDCTKVVVAHRLDTIMDSDVVVVMSEGRIVEVGMPDELLEKRDGWFSRLVEVKE